MFEQICKMSQPQLKEFVADRLLDTHKNIIIEDGFVFAKGEFPVLLVAHLDTVHKEPVRDIFIDKATCAISSPQGIGGDDRCGVYMILKVVKDINCSVLFCEDEEIGHIGAKKFINTELAKSLSF